MAATIARAIGRSRAKETETTRLGHEESEAQANTFLTFTKALMRKDGSGFIEVSRKGLGVIGRMEFSDENVGPVEIRIGTGSAVTIVEQVGGL